jgi:hypothetical protein
VKSVFIVHVGGTRCVTSSTDNIMKIHVRITLTVEFIRGYILIFLFYVWIQLRVWSILTLFSILLISGTRRSWPNTTSRRLFRKNTTSRNACSCSTPGGKKRTV